MTLRGLHVRVALLVLAVLAVHVWLLGGWPRAASPAPPAPAWNARTVEPAPPAAATPEPVQPPPAPQAAARAPAPPLQHATSSAAVAREATPAPRTVNVAAAVAPPARFHYDVTAQAKGLTLRGTALLEWRHDGREYDAQLSMNAPFIRARTQHSAGTITPEGLAPSRFSDKSRSEQAAHFDRGSGKVVFSTNKPQAVLEPLAQDRLSVVLQLGAMLAAAPSKYPPGTSITLQTASVHEAEPWTFTVEGPETLDLPGGRVASVRLQRLPRRDYDAKVELWLAPGADYAPVRLRLTQPNGDWVDQQWSSTDRR